MMPNFAAKVSFTTDKLHTLSYKCINNSTLQLLIDHYATATQLNIGLNPLLKEFINV